MKLRKTTPASLATELAYPHVDVDDLQWDHRASNLTIDPEQASQLIEAGREAVRHSPGFERLRHSLARTSIEPATATRPLLTGAREVD